MVEDMNGSLADLWAVGGVNDPAKGDASGEWKPTVCPACGWKLTGKFSHCPHCGADLSLIHCPYCGGEIFASLAQCPRCTAPLKNAQLHPSNNH